MAAGAVAGSAFADGVIVQSTSKTYRPSEPVGEGQTLTLGAGERIVVLDQSGALVAMDASGTYSAARAGKQPPERKLSAVRAAVFAERRPDMGAGRGDDLKRCIAKARLERQFTEAECRASFNERPETPTLTVQVVSGDKAKGGAPLSLSISTNFEAVVSCILGTRQDPDAGYALALAGDSVWLTTAKDKASVAPKAGSPTSAGMTAPTAPGNYKLTCRAVEAEIWREVRSAAPAASFGDMMTMVGEFARLRDAPTVAALRDYEVIGAAPAIASPRTLDSIVDRK